MDREPIYGMSDHYLGHLGEEYLNWQDEKGRIAGEINKHKFNQIDMKDKVLVDFGAGAGNLLSNLEAKRKIAIEINPAARAKVLSRGIEAFASCETLGDKSVDIVISNHALEHIPSPIEALRQIHRILKPGGILMLCVPIDDWRNQKRYNPTDRNHHLYTWTPQLLGNSLKEAGFNISVSDIQILRASWFPFYEHFYKRPYFRLLCYFASILTNHRELLVNVKRES